LEHILLNGKTILITGGTGSFGNKFTQRILSEYRPAKIIIYSRDEYKQFLMQKRLEKYESVLRFFIGDVRDKDRLYRAFNGVDYVIHAAALKQVPAAEYNPVEAIKTNIHGAINIIDAAIDCHVKKVVALSTDKAVNPINLYGATKLVSDKLFVSGNAYAGAQPTSFCVVRYGNVTGSRGSIVPFFRSLIEQGETNLPITDQRMTRFWITLDEGVDLVFNAIKNSKGGEIYVAKIPSYNVVDLAKAIKEDIKVVEIGIREGEKLHEVMISEEDSRTTYDYGRYFIIYPCLSWWEIDKHFTQGGMKVPDRFCYSSSKNSSWLNTEEIRERLKNIE
jgi:UDP-N-acetylglucosamine 4,6-dehydratase